MSTLETELHEAQVSVAAAYGNLTRAVQSLATAHVEYNTQYGELPPITSPASVDDPKMVEIVKAHREIALAERNRDAALLRIEEARALQGTLPNK